MNEPKTVELLPILNVPMRARSSATYLISVDLSHDLPRDAWPYDKEEIALTCLLDTFPLFTHQPVGQSTILVHRFGGSYGAARFMLTACEAAATGSIGISFINEQGMPVHYLRVDNVTIAPDHAAGPKATLPRIRAILGRASRLSRGAKAEGSSPREPETTPQGARAHQEPVAVSPPVVPASAGETGPRGEAAVPQSEAKKLVRKPHPPPPRPSVKPSAPSTATPASADAQPPGDEWYVGINGVPVGPVRLIELAARMKAGAVSPESLVWRDGFEDWRPLKVYPELLTILKQHAGAGASTTHQPAPKTSSAGQSTGLKFLCPSCKAKYQIAREKVAGRDVKMKCRKCGYAIHVSSTLLEARAGTSQAPAPRPATTSTAPQRPITHGRLADLEDEELIADDSWFSFRRSRVRTLRAAENYLAQQRIDDALEELRKLAAKTPGDVRTWLTMGDIEASRFNYFGALANYGRAAEWYADTEEDEKAQAVYGRMRDIIRFEAPALARTYPNVATRLAELLWKSGPSEDAVGLLKEIASGLTGDGRHAEAAALLRRLVVHEPSNAQIRGQLAAELVQSLSVTLGTATGMAACIAADSLLQQGKRGDAIAILYRATTEDKSIDTASRLAELQLAEKTPQAAHIALTTLRPFIQARVEDARALTVVAGALSLLNRGVHAARVHELIDQLPDGPERKRLWSEINALLSTSQPSKH